MPGPARIRESTLGDRPAIREMRRRVWHATYHDYWSWELIEALFDGEETLTDGRDQNWEEPFISHIAFVDGVVAGAATAGVRKDGEGELVALNVLPAQHGTGVAQQLWDESVTALAERGCQSMQIWVVAGNARAIRFYEKLGSVAFSTGQASIGGVAADEVGYRFVFPAG